MVNIFLKWTNYLYYFMDDEEYSKYFKHIFDSPRFNSSRIGSAKYLVNKYKFWESDYDSYIGLHKTYCRLLNGELFYHTIASEDEFNMCVQESRYGFSENLENIRRRLFP